MKRAFDLLVASLALFLLSPLILLLWLLVLMTLGSPAFFVQTRTGKAGLPFKIYKFRTMSERTDRYNQPLPDEERMTAIGSFLRSTSLDELPELWNIVKGDMSIVGPRPLLVDYMPLYTKEQSVRHTVRPGLTGWAQINGRNSLSWDDKFKFDIWYVDNRTFRLDLKIILVSVLKILKREGVTAEGSATTKRFKS